MFDISVYKLLKGNDGGKIDHLDWQNPMHLSSNYKENVNMRSIASLSALPRQLLYGGGWGWVGVDAKTPWILKRFLFVIDMFNIAIFLS